MQIRIALLLAILCLSFICDAIPTKAAMRLKQELKKKKHVKKEDPAPFTDANELNEEPTWETAVTGSAIKSLPAEVRDRIYSAGATADYDWCVTQYLSQGDPAVPETGQLHFEVSFAICLEGEQGNIDQIQALVIKAFDDYFANCKSYIVRPKVFFTCGPLAHYSYTLATCTEPDCRSFNIQPIIPVLNIQLKYDPAALGRPDFDCYFKYSVVHELLHKIYADKNGVPNSLTHDGTGSVWQSPGDGAIDNDGNVFHYTRNHFIACKENDATAKSFMAEEIQSYWMMSCRDKPGRGVLDNPNCYTV